MSNQINNSPVEIEALTVVKGRWEDDKEKNWWVLIELMGNEKSLDEK